MTSPTYLDLAKTFCINAESQTLSFFRIYLHFKSKWTPINSREISDKTTIQSDYLLVMTKSKGEFLPFWDIHLHWKNQNEPLINSGDYTINDWAFLVRFLPSGCLSVLYSKNQNALAIHRSSHKKCSVKKMLLKIS